jgi:uncharacterized coiled-coil protein SlyX
MRDTSDEPTTEPQSLTCPTGQCFLRGRTEDHRFRIEALEARQAAIESRQMVQERLLQSMQAQLTMMHNNMAARLTSHDIKLDRLLTKMGA